MIKLLKNSDFYRNNTRIYFDTKSVFCMVGKYFLSRVKAALSQCASSLISRCNPIPLGNDII